jgi:hypothetical protein
MSLEIHWFSGLLLDFDGTIIDSTEGRRPFGETMVILTLTLMSQQLKKIGSSINFLVL